MNIDHEEVGYWYGHREPVREIKIREKVQDGIMVSCGVSKDHDDLMMISFLLVDTKTGDVYRESFNCQWIDGEEKVDWLGQVLSRMFSDMVALSKFNQRRRTKNAFIDMAGSFGMALK